jgi:hypothetical protein
MADRVLFIGWKRPVVGREQRALQLWQKVMAYYARLQGDGRIESFEPVLLTAHGGDLNGFVLLKGTEQKLAEVRREDTFVNFTIEAEMCLEGFGVVVGYVGEGLADVFTRWTKAISS